VKNILYFLQTLTPDQVPGFLEALALDRVQTTVSNAEYLTDTFDDQIAASSFRASEVFATVSEMREDAIESEEMQCACGVSVFEHADGVRLEELLAAMKTGNLRVNFDLKPEAAEESGEEIPTSKPTIH
jgi:hypothetical protein